MSKHMKPIMIHAKSTNLEIKVEVKNKRREIKVLKLIRELHIYHNTIHTGPFKGHIKHNPDTLTVTIKTI